MDKKEQVTLEVWNDKITINIIGMKKLAFVDYTPEMYDLIRNARFRIPYTEEAKENYKYPYSNEYKKSLHQISFDYYFGEELRKEANDIDSNEGKVLYDDGENQVYVEKVLVDGQSEVYFRSSGNYSLRGATLVSGNEHARIDNGFTSINHVNATATYQGDSFKIYQSGSSGLNYRDGDSFGFYLLITDDKEVDVDIEKDSIIEVKLSNLYMHNWEKK